MKVDRIENMITSFARQIEFLMNPVEIKLPGTVSYISVDRTRLHLTKRNTCAIGRNILKSPESIKSMYTEFLYPVQDLCIWFESSDIRPLRYW
jgi:hypothetical protein